MKLTDELIQLLGNAYQANLLVGQASDTNEVEFARVMNRRAEAEDAFLKYLKEYNET